MYVMLITVFSLLAYGVATGVFVWYGVALLDFCMDYPNPFWKWRYWAAKRFTKDPAALEQWLEVASGADFEDKAALMEAHYQEIAAKAPGFKRWICVYCLSTFVGVFVAGIIAIILVSLYGWGVILYWLSVFPTIGFIGASK